MAGADPAKSILVPLDGSTESERALDVALPLAQATQARVVLIWVYEGLKGLDRGLPQEEAEAADRAELDRRRGILEEVRGRLTTRAGAAASVEVTVPMGPAAKTILKAAAEQRARLIVMATHSRGALPRWYLGSVATDVANTSPVPTLLYHADADRPPPPAYSRIAVPVELAADTHAAIEAAAALAAELQGELLLVSLVASDEEADDAARWQDVLRSRYADLTIRHETREGPLVDALLNVAPEVDLIVMAARDPEGWRRFFKGRDQNEVVREAGIPVMLVAGPD
jgi:nucleotide-binding universal stress UspA family protein